jgi:hypothetical protein
MTWSIAVVCEADADRRTAATITTKVLCTEIDWFDESYLNFRGYYPADERLLWREVKELALANNIVSIGFMNGLPASPDAHTTKKALMLFARSEHQPEAVLLLRDSDNDTTRLDGLNAGRDAEPWPFPVVIGFAHTKRECWHLAGFQAKDEEERNRLEAITSELGFHPCRDSHLLTARSDPNNAKLSAKRVLSELVGDDFEREAECLQNLTQLREHGAENGLSNFMLEIATRLVPLFGGNQSVAK